MEMSAMQFDVSNKMSTLNAFTRILLGSALIVFVLLSTDVVSTREVSLLFLSIPIILSGLFRWDPIYSILHKRNIPKVLVRNTKNHISTKSFPAMANRKAELNHEVA